MQNEWITIGKLMRPHGVRGEIKCAPQTHDLNRHRQLQTVSLLFPNGNRQELVIQKSSLQGDLWLFKFEGFESPEAVQALVHSELQVPLSQRIPPPVGQYYFSDLAGLNVLDSQGNPRGTVVRVDELPSVNAFVLRVQGKDIYAPWIDACVEEVNLENRTLRVNFDYLADLLGESHAH